MKKLFNTVRTFVNQAARRIAAKVSAFRCEAKHALTAGASGEGYIDTAVKILVAVVLGALLLAGLYALFGDVVMPTLNERIRGMFDYAGSVS